ncbi:hypothetical protein A2_00180 [Pseudomonas phage BIM BV-45]|nr:hypothetical protein A2_00180 [Pseudomonas phage BIM BV-45]
MYRSDTYTPFGPLIEAVFDEVRHIFPEAHVTARADERHPGHGNRDGQHIVRISVFRHNRELCVESSFPGEQFAPPIHVIATTMRRQFVEGVNKALRDYDDDLRRTGR